jgi:hypothetical protein
LSGKVIQKAITKSSFIVNNDKELDKLLDESGEIELQPYGKYTIVNV